jgi:hypothetical protein
MRLEIVLDPDTLAPPLLHVAMEFAIKRSAVTLRFSAGRVITRPCVVAPLFAVLSNPMVKVSIKTAVPSGSGTVACEAVNIPPVGGSVTSANLAAGPPNSEIDAPNASPLKVVAAVEVEVDVNQAEARGTVEYTKSGTTVITTRSMRILEDFSTFAAAALEIIWRFDL